MMGAQDIILKRISQIKALLNGWKHMIGLLKLLNGFLYSFHLSFTE